MQVNIIKMNRMNVEDLSENEILINLLKHYRIIFKNERTPQMKEKKELALHYLTNEFNLKTKQTLTVKQIKKKLNNLKSRLKQTHENKNIILKNWEQEFLHLWMSRGQIYLHEQDITPESVSETSMELKIGNAQSISEMKMEKNDDTFKNINTDDLNRMRLIAQIKTAEAQRRAAIAQREAAIAQKDLAILKRNLILQVNGFPEDE